MFDRQDAVHKCDFCQKELNYIHYIYSESNMRFPNELCRTCLSRRIHLTTIKNKKRLWR